MYKNQFFSYISSKLANMLKAPSFTSERKLKAYEYNLFLSEVEKNHDFDPQTPSPFHLF